jgi:hypothetical protein
VETLSDRHFVGWTETPIRFGVDKECFCDNLNMVRFLLTQLEAHVKLN